MKKLLFFFLGSIMMSCSLDEDGDIESVGQIPIDPIIGVWQSQQGLFLAVFNENGTLRISEGNMHPYGMFDSWCTNIDQTVTGFWSNVKYGRNYENITQFYAIMNLCGEGGTTSYVYRFSNDFNTVSISGQKFVGTRQ